jgi:hypothetical protein
MRRRRNTSSSSRRRKLVQIEFGALGSTHNIAGVTDLDDRKQVAFAGGFAEFRYLRLKY